MTNEEKFKTWEERGNAFVAFCKRHRCGQCVPDDRPVCPIGGGRLYGRGNCQFAWLELEYEEPEPELKSCPFCGGKADIHKTQLAIGYSYYISCSNCGVSTPLVFSEDKVLTIWNRRVK